MIFPPGRRLLQWNLGNHHHLSNRVPAGISINRACKPSRVARVQGCKWFIHQQQIRFQHQGQGDCRPLPLTTGDTCPDREFTTDDIPSFSRQTSARSRANWRSFRRAAVHPVNKTCGCGSAAPFSRIVAHGSRPAITFKIGMDAGRQTRQGAARPPSPSAVWLQRRPANGVEQRGLAAADSTNRCQACPLAIW